MKVRTFNEEEYFGYLEKVEEILESFQYPEMILDFCPHCIARSISGTVQVFYFAGESPMMCAIVIWSMTLNEQVIPATKHMTKH